ncbi:MAG: peptidoglycan-binding protein [Parcubacteria group bacterium]|jgi:hypothetical protein
MNKKNKRKTEKNIFIFLAFLILSIGFVIFPRDAKAAPSISTYNMITNKTTPDVKGTISGVTGTAEVSVTINAIEYSLDSVTNGNWSMTVGEDGHPLESEHYYTVEITATDGTGDNSTTAYIYVDEGCPYEFYYTGDGGEEAEFSSITFSETYNYTSDDGLFSLSFPAGTVVVQRGGGTFDLADWYAEIVDSNNERIISKLRFGIPDEDLDFSVHDVIVTFNVGEEYSGQSLNIFSRGDGDNDEGWEPLEIDCTVTEGGSCTFSINHASYFSISQYTSIAETEEGENDDNDDDNNDDDSETAHIDSWKAYRYEDANKSCSSRLKLTIKGKYFDKNAEVKIGNNEASSVNTKSSKKIVAKFCMSKLLDNQASHKKTISVTNSDADMEKADKKINLDDVGYSASEKDFDIQTTEGAKSIQAALAKLGFLDEGYVTGFYGLITTNAVVEFQKQNGISQTGYVGPLTKTKLEEKMK